MEMLDICQFQLFHRFVTDRCAYYILPSTIKVLDFWDSPTKSHAPGHRRFERLVILDKIQHSNVDEPFACYVSGKIWIWVVLRKWEPPRPCCYRTNRASRPRNLWRWGVSLPWTFGVGNSMKVNRKILRNLFLGGGFKYFLFSLSPLLGEMIQFDDHIFQRGWWKTTN